MEFNNFGLPSLDVSMPWTLRDLVERANASSFDRLTRDALSMISEQERIQKILGVGRYESPINREVRRMREMQALTNSSFSCRSVLDFRPDYSELVYEPTVTTLPVKSYTPPLADPPKVTTKVRNVCEKKEVSDAKAVPKVTSLTGPKFLEAPTSEWNEERIMRWVTFLYMLWQILLDSQRRH
jgi:hypothetical protein